VRSLRALIVGLTLLLPGTRLGTASAEASRPLYLSATDSLGHPFDLRMLRGKVVAVTFTSRYTRDEATKVIGQLEQRGGEDLQLITIVDMAGVPSLFHGYLKRRVAEADRKSAVRHLVDGDGRLKTLFGAVPDREVDVFIIDRRGELRGRFVGHKQVEEALRLIEQLRVSAATM
jgi:hypothetical protein